VLIHLGQVFPSGTARVLESFLLDMHPETPSLLDAALDRSGGNGLGEWQDSSGLYVRFIEIRDAGTAGERALVEVASLGGLSVVSAASYTGGGFAPDQTVVAYGDGTPLAGYTAQSTGLPLPTSLGDTEVELTDSAGRTHKLPMFWTDPNAVAFLIDDEVARGRATLKIKPKNKVASVSALDIDTVNPGLFTANQNGRGAALGLLFRPVIGDYQPLYQFVSGAAVAAPVELELVEDDALRNWFVLYGTGFRHHGAPCDAPTSVRCSIFYVTDRCVIGRGEIDASTGYACEDGGGSPGLDQINLGLPNSFVRFREQCGPGKGQIQCDVVDPGSGVVKQSNVVDFAVR
jgi:uncharacterized protein (TIGR03437 family)